MEITERDVCDMTFHEVKHCNNEVFDCTIMKVYKGWTYTFFKREVSISGADRITSSSVFVPE